MEPSSLTRSASSRPSHLPSHVKDLTTASLRSPSIGPSPHRPSPAKLHPPLSSAEKPLLSMSNGSLPHKNDPPLSPPTKRQLLPRSGSGFRPPNEHRQTIFCSFLAGVIFVLFCAMRLGPEEPRVFDAVSLDGLSHLSEECSFLEQLPYSPANPPLGRFKAAGIHTFVFMASHRVSAWEFAIIGLGAKDLRDAWEAMEEGCLWVSFEGPKGIKGKLEYIFPGDHKGLMYETIILRCYLDKGTSNTAGGTLFVDIHGEDVLVRREDPGRRTINPPTPLPHKLSFCSLLLSQKVRANRVQEFLLYIRFFGVDHVVLYDGGAIDDDFLNAIDPFVKAGFVDMVDVRGVTRFDAVHDTLVVNDCALRTRFESQWTMVGAFDEWPIVMRPHALPRLFALNAGRPWISFGAHPFHSQLCTPLHDNDEWPIERMVFWKQDPICANSSLDPKQCPGEAGRRRFFFDPRQVLALLPHTCVAPLLGGIHLNTTIIRSYYFESLVDPASLLCEYHMMGGSEPKLWKKNAHLSKTIRQGRVSGLLSLPTL